jgi:hypothetical protein
VKLSLACLVVAAIVSAPAVITVALSIEELTQDAEVICRGRVSAMSCQRDPEGRIYTRIELAVSHLWKGALPQDPFILVQGGGTLGRDRTRVGGAVPFKLAEEVVVFAVLNSRGQGVPLSLGQGKFRLWLDPVTGKTLAANLFHGPTLTREAALQRQTSSSAGLFTVEELERRVRASMP